MAQKSKYATKRESGKMMYGPGCCAHSVTTEQMERRRREADKARRLERFDAIVAGSMRGAGALTLDLGAG